MKKKSNSFFVVLLVSVLGATIVSCSNSDYFGVPSADNQPGVAVDDEGISLKHLTSEVGGSRAAEQNIQFYSLHVGSDVGITMYNEKIDDETADFLRYDNLCYNVGEAGALTLDESRSSTTNPTKPFNRKLTYYAYAPFNSSFLDKGSYAFTVKTDQSSLDNYIASDLLWAKVSGVGSASTGIPFRHLYSIVHINLSFEDGIDPNDYTGGVVSFMGIKPTATVNLEDGTLSEASGVENPIKAFKIVKDGDTYTLKGSVVFPPQTVYENEEILRIEWPGNVSMSFLMKNDRVYESGKYYTLTRTLTSESLSDLSGSVGNVKEWVTVEEETAEFERD